MLAAPLAGALGTIDLDAEAPAGYARLTTALAAGTATGVLDLEGTVTATDGWDVKQVLVWVDDQLVGRAYPWGGEWWSFRLDTTRLADGPHVLQLCGMIAPEDAPGTVTVNGGGDTVAFTTANANEPVTLYERHVRVTGASEDAWSFLVDRAYTGLRVTVAPADAAVPLDGAVAQVVVTYHEPGSVAVGPPERASVATAPPKAWVATYGPAPFAYAVSERGDAAIVPGGLITLTGAYAGTGGEVRVSVEAIPAG